MADTPTLHDTAPVCFAMYHVGLTAFSRTNSDSESFFNTTKSTDAPVLTRVVCENVSCKTAEASKDQFTMRAVYSSFVGTQASARAIFRRQRGDVFVSPMRCE